MKSLQELLVLARNEDLGDVACMSAEEIDSLREQLNQALEHAAQEYLRGYDVGAETEREIQEFRRDEL